MKPLLRMLVLAVLVAGLSSGAFAQATYTWNNTTVGNWADANNWTPVRTTPAVTDTLVFDGGVTPSVVDTGVVTQTIGELRLINGARVVFRVTSARTLTISGNLLIDATSSLIDSARAAITLALATGARGNVYGYFAAKADTLPAVAHKITVADTLALTFQSGSVCRVDSTFSSNLFGTAPLNRVIFASGSTYSGGGGSNPFGGSGANSVVVFQPGSLFKFTSRTGAPAFSGRTGYADIEIDAPGNNIVATGSSPFTCTNLTVTNGSLTFNFIGAMTIKGNIAVASTGSLAFGLVTSSTTPTLAGSSIQSITGTGVLNFGPLGNLTINNPAGVSLGKDLVVGGTLTFTNGNFTLGSSNLTLKKAVTGALSGRSIVTNGAGVVRDSIAANGSFVFPLSSNGVDYTPMLIQIGASDPAELFSVSVATGVTPAFSDNATTVQRTWSVSEGTAGGNHAILGFVWPESVEGASFTRGSSAAWMNNGSGWLQASSGVLATGNPDTLTTNYPVSSFGAFTVANGIPMSAVTKTTIDFGKVSVGLTKTDSVAVKNTGLGSLNVTNAVSSDTVFTVTPTTATIAAGDSAWFHVTFTPKVVIVKNATLTFTANGGTGSQNSVALTGEGYPSGFALNKSSLNFNGVSKDSSKVDSVVVLNGSASLTLVIDSVKSSNPFFVVSPLTASIGAMGSATFRVTFSPLTKGPASGNVVFYHNGVTQQDTLKVSGSGLVKEPLFSATPASFDFKNVLLGQSKSDSVTVKNIGSDSLFISAVASTDTSYTVTPTVARLDTGATKKFYITFAPKAAGVKAAGIVFTSNVSELSDTVKVTGKGYQFISIAAARALPVGSDVAIEGVVTRAFGAYSYLQQDTAAIVIYQSTGSLKDSILAGAVKSGTKIAVTGKTSSYNSLIEIGGTDIASWSKTGTGTVPAPVQLTLAQVAANGSKYQAQLIQVKNLTLVSTDTFFKPRTTYNVVDPTDTTKAVALRIGNAPDTWVDSMATPGVMFMFVGPLGQFSSSDPTKGFQLMPIDSTDIAANPLSVEEHNNNVIPTVYALEQNYPNPFNPSTTINFSIPTTGMASLTVYNVLGQQIMTLVNEVKAAGNYSVRFEASSLPSGMYFYRLQAGSFSMVKKMLLVK